MSSGVSRVVTGAFVGTGAEVEVEVGFKPSLVLLDNVGGLACARHYAGMADASAVKEITAGTKSLITSNGITLEDSGFKLGADTDLNVDGELVRWTAFEGAGPV